MEIPKEIIAAAIAAIPAVLAPWISSSLQRRGLARKAREVEVIEKRVQVIERLLSLDQQLSEDKRNILQDELADIVHDIVAERAEERSVIGTDASKLPRWKRYLLFYSQPTLKASVYRGFYWLFLFFVLIMLIFPFIEETKEPLPVAIFGGLFYLAIGLTFRAAAVRQQKHAQALVKEKQDATTHSQNK